jgi:ATPase subunit of ABC transporter with duplicated ATPase domains
LRNRPSPIRGIGRGDTPYHVRAEASAPARSPNSELTAWDRFLKGLSHYYHQTKADSETAIALFKEAIELDPALSIADNLARLHPELDENGRRALLAHFRFRGDAALQRVGSLSGGQMLRAGLACVLGSAPPPLLILDEPTNHLDLEAIEAVEAGLRGYDGALLVVSHDERFLDAIGITRRIALG